MPDVTFIIPVGPYHIDIATRAVASAEAQTIPCDVVRVDDPDGKGPAYARNRALERIRTAFVVFLDADDWVEPNFVERCLSVWEPGRYVYTDWVRDDLEVIKAYPAPWCDDLQWHPITTLLPKDAVDKVGGFDSLPGGEDTEFYWSLTRSAKCCGIHLPEALFHYTKGGQRSKQWLAIGDGQGPHDFTANPNYIAHMRLLQRRYGHMGCCREQADTFIMPAGEAGDVLVRAIWGGNQVRRGPITGRWYPRSGNGAIMKVDPRDAQAMPQWWRIIPLDTQAPPHIQQANGIADVARILFPGYQTPRPSLPTLAQIEAVERTDVQPDFRRVNELARAAYGE